MKNLLLLIALLSSSYALGSDTPCYWAGDFVKCYPTGGIYLDNSKTLRLGTNDASHYVELKAPDGVATSWTMTPPATHGSINQLLYNSDGSGLLGWTDPGITTAQFYGILSTFNTRQIAGLVCHSNVTLSGTQTCDGQSTSNAVGVIAMAQTDPTENGLWINDDFVAWTRPQEMTSIATLPGSLVSVTSASGGTSYPNTLWYGIGDGVTTANFLQVPLMASNANLSASSPVITNSLGQLTTESSLAITRGGTAKTSVTTAPAATSWAGWDANKNLSANSFISGYTTTATAATTTTLAVGSTYQQYFTGSTTQTVVLPVASTLVLGQKYQIVNLSSGVVTVQSSGANTVQALAANTMAVVTCILTSGTTAASWSVDYSSITGSGTGTVTSVAMTVPSFLSVAGSPVTTSGTLDVTLSGTALPVANGGTGAVTLASNGVLYGNSTSAVQALAVNSTATNKFLTQVSSAAPAWSTIAAGDLPAATSTTAGSVSREDSGTFACNFTGARTSNLTCKYSRVGNSVTVVIPADSGTAGASAAQTATTALPSSIRPAVAVSCLANVLNASNTTGTIYLTTAGTIIVYAGLSSNNFTSGQNVGWSFSDILCSYTLN